MNLIPDVDASEEMLVLEQLAYQSAMYLPLGEEKFEVKEGDTLQDIINSTVEAIHKGSLRKPNESDKDYNKRINDYQTYIKELVDVIDAHPEIGTAEIGHLSWQMKDPETDKNFLANGMVACTFVNSETKQNSICFRGTPSGSWIDNAKGITGVYGAGYLEKYPKDATDEDALQLSPMQCAALRYVGLINEESNGNGEWSGSGHSKGGNEIQLAAMVFPELFEHVYAFDGQSFPQITLDKLCCIKKR